MRAPRFNQPTRRPSGQGRWLTTIYVAALSSVALLTLGGQWLIQRQLVNGEADSQVINIAGRQRMLSQRLAKAALQLTAADAKKPPARAELAETLSSWASSHAALRDGDPDLGLPGGASVEIEKMFAKIEPDFIGMKSAAETLLDLNSDLMARAVAVDEIQEREGRFLRGMDSLVSQYVIEAEQRVGVLKNLERAILFLTLAVLAVEGLFIFRPAVHQIDRTLDRLNRVGQRLRLAKADAEQADAAKSRFLANVSHELRTPMTAVLGMTELAREEEDPIKRESHLATVIGAGQLLLSLLNDLIDFARVDSGKLELQPAPFSPHHVLSRVVRMMRPACAAKGINLAPLLAVDADLKVIGDSRRLEQVLLNLIGNSIKWTSEGAVYARCEVTAESDSHVTLRYAVQDTGKGISEDNLQKVFEPFAQVDGDKTTASGGVGLGLAICKRIADAMGAELRLTSMPDMGTTVSLIGKYERAPVEALLDKPNRLPIATVPQRLLVVEDTEVNQLLLREFLTRDGHDVTVVGSGEEALRLPTSHRFDAALIDLQLPGIDGVETAQAIRRRFGSRKRPLKLLCVTADARQSVHASALDDVFDAVVTKPINREELRAALAIQPSTEPLPMPTPAQANAPLSLHQELAQAYLSVALKQEAELKRAIDDHRWGDSRVLAHRLKGQVGYFEADALVTDLSRLESACESGNQDLVGKLSPGVLLRLEELRQTLPVLFSVRGSVSTAT